MRVFALPRRPFSSSLRPRGDWCRLAGASLIALLAACGGSGDAPSGNVTAPPITPAPVTPGILGVAVVGLPAGAAGDFLVTGVAGFSRAGSVDVVWSDVPAGRYTVTVRPVRNDRGTFGGSPVSFTVDVPAAAVAQATVAYEPLPSVLALDLIGVPGGAQPPVTLTFPGGRATSVLQSGVFTAPPQTGTNLVPEQWKVQAQEFTVAGTRFLPAPSDIDTVLRSGDTARVAVRYGVGSGAIAVVVGGLPNGVAGDLALIGPDNRVRPLSSTTTITGLDAGRYRLIVNAVTAGGLTFRPANDTLTLDVTLSLVATPATVTYAAQAGRLDLQISGLPSGSPATLTLRGPGVTRTITADVTFDSLPSGSYTLDAPSVIVNGERYAATPATRAITIATGSSQRVNISYAVAPTTVDVVVSGLPGGTTAAITLTAPNGDITPVSASMRVAPATPGRWRLSAQPVNASGATFSPTPSQYDQTVAPGDALLLPVQYTVSTGSLAIVVAGLPNGAAGAVTVTGPGNFSQTVTSTRTLTGLVPGSYTITANVITDAGNSYAASVVTQTVTVAASLVAAPATVTYGISSGSLALTIGGLPNGAGGSVLITGPGSFARTLTATTTLTGLVPGAYTVTAQRVLVNGNEWAGSPSSQVVTVSASTSAAPVAVSYTLGAGALAIAVNGVPNGTPAAITVAGPNAYSQNVTASTTLSGLVPGNYTVSATPVTSAGNSFTPTSSSQTITVVSSSTSATAVVTYVQSTGSLALAVLGLPNGASGSVAITGPSAFSRTLTGTQTLTGLTPGSYTVTAANVLVSGVTWTAAPAAQTVNVTTSAVAANASVSYTSSGGGGGVNYTLSNVYLTQAIQKPDNSVSLVANRDALLRAFVTASATNSATPSVRVRIYDGPTLIQTTTLTAPETSVRTTTAEGTLTSTWNTIVPAANVRTTMRVLVDLDPTQAVADNDRADNTWPSTGTPASIAVSTVPPFTVRFVPVIIGALTGNVSNLNKDAFLVSTRRMWPVQSVVSDVRLPFTSSATELQSGDGNGQWLTVLSEMNTLRTADGAPNAMHYYGVVKVTYNSGIAGYGYQPGRAAIGWDYLPSGDNVAAHEWGHNFSRQHAPCGVGGDPGYPYAGGVTNFWGWNSGTGALVSPGATDVMSYCNNNWVSDYNWTGVMNFRATSGLVASASGASSNAKTDGLLVWGRVVDGVIQLEPAFRVTAPLTPVANRPTHRVDLLDDAGASLLQLPIEASIVDHVEGREERHFAVVVPWSAALEDRLASIRVSDPRAPLRSVARRTPFASPAAVRAGRAAMSRADAEPTETLDRESGGRVRVSWQNGSYGMAMVRDAATGQIIGYVRRPGAGVATGGRAVDVVFSDGVRSTVRSVR